MESFYINPFGVCADNFDYWKSWTIYSWKSLQRERRNASCLKCGFLILIFELQEEKNDLSIYIYIYINIYIYDVYIYIYIYICIYNKFNKYIRENVTKTYEHL